MRVLKRAYELPADVLESFEAAVAPGQRSAVIARLLREWAGEQHRIHLRQEIIEGCRVMANVYREIEREYHPLEEEVAHALDV